MNKLTQEELNEQISEGVKKSQETASNEKTAQNQEQDVSNAEDMSEPKAPKSKTQELDKAIKEIKKQKSRPMTENQAETLQN